MPVGWDKVEEVTLALLTPTGFEDHGVPRSWKGHDWDVMNRLHESGWNENPVGRPKSVVLTDEGARQSRTFFDKYFVVDADAE